MTADDKLDAIAAALEKLSDRLDVLQRLIVPSTATMLRPREAAQVLGIRIDHVYDLIATGQLEATDVAHFDAKSPRWRISPAAMLDFHRRRAAKVPKRWTKRPGTAAQR